VLVVEIEAMVVMKGLSVTVGVVKMGAVVGVGVGVVLVGV